MTMTQTLPRRPIIGGRRVDAAEGAMFQSGNPASQEAPCEAPRAAPEMTSRTGQEPDPTPAVVRLP